MDDSGFRVELFENPILAAASGGRGWDTVGKKRFDGLLSELTPIDDGGDLYFVYTAPLEYLQELVDLEDFDDNTDTFDMEYFLNYTDASFIKNRLTFKLVDKIID